ncbi:thioredoxin domain-containing protein 17-like [Stegodyphus dumicola]|uniref:thioredoxin domain-containing protein 17-like n=1 Tax=Stegodyphus dumicola TaxID=202533 RepID=UPI0015B28E11|nr:thioredoxin domain-containing protein 17-like [Stegodyphus dumicola]
MAKIVRVEGYQPVKNAITEFSKSHQLFLLFTGAEDAEGRSWCPDCVDAKPVIFDCLKYAPEKSVLVICSVGNRNAWKDPNNDFRKDEQLKLTCVPTLIKFNTPKRLEEEQCKSAALVSMLFED